MIKATVVFDNYKIIVNDHVIGILDEIVVFGVDEVFPTIEQAIKYCMEN